MMKKPISFLKLLLPSFFIYETLVYLLVYWGAPEFLQQSEYRIYIMMFFFWSGLIGSPIIAVMMYGLLKKKPKGDAKEN